MSDSEPDQQQPPGQPGSPAGWSGWSAPPTPPPTVAGHELASWGRRALALLIDTAFLGVMIVPGVSFIGTGAAADSDGDGPDQPNGALVAVGVVLLLGAIGTHIWQQGWRQGSRGQSWGKRLLGIRLVRLADGLPLGGWPGVGRMLLRVVLGQVSCGIYGWLTYLWPLWDGMRQTLDDKIFRTAVVSRPRLP